MELTDSLHVIYTINYEAIDFDNTNYNNMDTLVCLN